MPNILNTTHMEGRTLDLLLDIVKGRSVLAKLTGQIPLRFEGADVATICLDNEADLVGEGAAKSNGGATMNHQLIKPVKFEYGTRVTDEFMYMDAEGQVSILESFVNGMAKKFARALDIAALHGMNPRTSTASTLIGTNYFDALVTNVVPATADIYNDVNAAITLLHNSDQEISGAAFSPAALHALANVQDTTKRPLFPETGWGLDVTNIKGLPVAASSTVSFAESGLLAVVGDFENGFKYGVAKSVPMKMIECGDPDNTGRDLAGHNEVYLRGEIFYGWAILSPDSFVIVKTDD